jgi:hypothetical protein
MRRKTLLLVIISLVITMTSCYTANGNLTPSQIYLAADREFTLTLKQYNDWYDMQSPETQEVWKLKIDPLFVVGSSTLDNWKMVLKAGGSGEIQEEELLKLKSQILHMMYEAGVFQK